ncbi:unnamed protein product [Plutella xylostella]|uniref:(diamondback moth) hypothetical protein n=1 Tax=Plutella xylostella TaxID=51655 RepID=A0A8S4CYJ4_PLUXY|nr:unnamed protein product [Plutella xylostella]
MKSSPSRKYENLSNEQLGRDSDKYSIGSQDTASVHSSPEEGGGKPESHPGAGDMWISAVESSILSWEEVAARLNVDVRRGLSWREANDRMNFVGPNEFHVKEEEPLWRKYIEQFQNPLILLLLGDISPQTLKHRSLPHRGYIHVSSMLYWVRFHQWLSWREANDRMNFVGPNEFHVKEEEPLWRKYIEQFQNPLILLLLGEWIE